MLITTISCTPTPSINLHPAIIDTGTTGHYITADAPCNDSDSTAPAITVYLPDGQPIKSTASTRLELPLVNTEAKTAHIFPTLHKNSLISVGALCDDDCEAVFSRHKVVITKNDTVILTGTRKKGGLWMTNLQNNEPSQQAHAITQHRNIKDAIQFLHAACFSPIVTTWTKAIENGNFITWPTITVGNVTKHATPSAATIKGHMDQERKNKATTKVKEKGTTTENDNDLQPTPITMKTNFVYAAVVDPKVNTGLTFMDLTGRFPAQSSKGNNYILIVYDYDSNAILAEPLKNRSDQSICMAYQQLHNKLKRCGLKPQLQRLDNEATKALKEFLQEEKVDYQLVPTDMDRHNAAEFVIRTWKTISSPGYAALTTIFPCTYGTN